MWQNILWNIAEEGASVALVEALRVNDLIPTSTPASTYVKIGAVWAVSDELLVAMRDKSSSNLLNGNLFGLVDEIFLNTLLAAGADMSGAAEMIANAVGAVPFDDRIKSALANGAIKVGSKLALTYIPLDGTPFETLKHITSLIR